MLAMTGRRLSRLGVSDAPSKQHAERRLRVLLAEDDPSLRRLLAEAIGRAGFEVEEVESGHVLAARIKHVILSRSDAVPFDAIVSDLRMPGPSGMSMLRVLRMFDAVTPFVLMTAYGDQGTREAHVLGATAVLDKPLTAAAIVRELQRGLHAHAGDTAWRTTESGPERTKNDNHEQEQT